MSGKEKKKRYHQLPFAFFRKCYTSLPNRLLVANREYSYWNPRSYFANATYIDVAFHNVRAAYSKPAQQGHPT
jgi:hypothetical protein